MIGYAKIHYFFTSAKLFSKKGCILNCRFLFFWIASFLAMTATRIVIARNEAIQYPSLRQGSDLVSYILTGFTHAPPRFLTRRKWYYVSNVAMELKTPNN